jgi:hypothetical protein
VNRTVKKALALAVMLAALVAVFEGLGYVNNYTSQVTIRTPYLQKSIVVEPKEYGVIASIVNESGDHELRIFSNGTLRVDAMPESFYLSWVNGSYQPSFSSATGPNEPGIGGYYPVSDYQGEPWYYAYWNVYSNDSIEVKMDIVQASSQTVYNYSNLGSGVFLVAAGVVSGLAAAYSVSKRTMLVVISLALIFSGAITITNNSRYSNFDKVVASKTILVPANANVTEPIHYNQTGSYVLRLTVNNGTINATALSRDEYGSFMRGEYSAYWEKGRYDFGVGGGVSDGVSSDAVLLLINADAYGKEVAVQFQCYWEGYDYATLIIGAAAFAGGLAVFYFTNRRQIKAFNRELENQSNCAQD